MKDFAPGAKEINSFFGTATGMLGLTTYLEFEAPALPQNVQIWMSIAGTFVNRFNLSPFLKSAYGFSAGSIQSIIQQRVIGSQVWQSGNLSSQSYSDVEFALNGSPNTNQCNGFIAAFNAAQYVLSGGRSPSGDSLFYASGTSIPSTFYSKRLVNSIFGTTKTGTTLFRFWDIANPPAQPVPRQSGPPATPTPTPRRAGGPSLL